MQQPLTRKAEIARNKIMKNIDDTHQIGQADDYGKQRRVAKFTSDSFKEAVYKIIKKSRRRIFRKKPERYCSDWYQILAITNETTVKATWISEWEVCRCWPDQVYVCKHAEIWNTAKSTVISPNFLVWKYCGKAQFPHQEISWNYGIFRSESNAEILCKV